MPSLLDIPWCCSAVWFYWFAFWLSSIPRTAAINICWWWEFLAYIYLLLFYYHRVCCYNNMLSYSIPSSSPATAHNQEFWAQAKTRCKLGTYQISYILSSTILVPSRNKCGKSIHDHILTSLCFLSKCKMWTKYSWHMALAKTIKFGTFKYILFVY